MTSPEVTPDQDTLLGTVYDAAEPPEELVSVYYGFYLGLRINPPGPVYLLLNPREAIALADLLYYSVEEHY